MYEVLVAVEETNQKLSDLLKEDGSVAVEKADGHDSLNQDCTAICKLPKQGHLKRNKQNREYINLSIGVGAKTGRPCRTSHSMDNMDHMKSMKAKVIAFLIKCLRRTICCIRH